MGRERGFHDHARHQNAAGARKGDLKVEPPESDAGGAGGAGGAEPEEPEEPEEHRLGRSRGGWTTTLHLACEQGRRPLSLLVTAGLLGDSPQFAPVIEASGVPRSGGGRPRTRPDRVLADKAYSSRANRVYLRRREIEAAIDQPRDQVARRQAKGSSDGWPLMIDRQISTQRHAIECDFNLLKQHRAVAARHDKLAVRSQATVQVAVITLWLRHMWNTR